MDVIKSDERNCVIIEHSYVNEDVSILSGGWGKQDSDDYTLLIVGSCIEDWVYLEDKKVVLIKATWSKIEGAVKLFSLDNKLLRCLAWVLHISASFLRRLDNNMVDIGEVSKGDWSICV